MINSVSFGALILFCQRLFHKIVGDTQGIPYGLCLCHHIGEGFDKSLFSI